MENIFGALRLSGFVAILGLFATEGVLAQSFSGLYSQPLVGNTSAAPLFLLTMQRDARLFVEAYDDASDINGDGMMDTKYNPALMEYDPIAKVYTTSVLDYFGNFDSYKCYEYKNYSYRDTAAGSNKTIAAFVPIGSTDNGSKKCTSYSKSGVNTPWSGDFLNYLTTTRMDALRKVLYGGKRFIDFAYYTTNKTAATVLERAWIPQDLHAYGKEYTSVAVDGYNIADYTPLALPTTGKRHLFANVTLGAAPTAAQLSANPPTYNPPLLRILQNRDERAWDWIAAETGRVANTPLNDLAVIPSDLNVRVVVCDTYGGTSQLPTQGGDQHYCKQYGNGYKPTGVLHDFGENNSVYFGLLTGSYKNNFSGGLLRKAISSFAGEVNPTTGEFIGKFNNDAATVKGIAYAIDRMQVMGYTFSGGADFNTTEGTGNGISSTSVGNPIAEMMYEGLRYLAGNTTPTTQFTSGITLSSGLTNETPKLPALMTWTNPYGGSGFNVCAKPTQMVLSDVNPTFDSDELPGSSDGFRSVNGLTLGNLNVATLANLIWNSENLGTKNLIIGEKNSETTSTMAGLPTAKSSITGFSMIRGLVPEDPKWQGSYFSAAVAKFGKETDLKSLGNSAFASSTITDRVVDTAVVALSSALPRIQIPFTDSSGNTTVVNVVPFAQRNGGSNTSWYVGDFMKMYIDDMKNVPGAPMDATVNGGDPYYKMHIVFSDNSLYFNRAQDNDMDARATYEVYLDKVAKKVYVNVCADPIPTAQASPSSGKPTTTQTVRCNKNGVDGVGYAATGVQGMHLGYFVSGVKIPTGESQTRLVVRIPGYGWPTANTPQDFVHPLDLASARIAGSFNDNFFDGNLNNTVTYTGASDGKSLRLNHAMSYDIDSVGATGEFVPHDPLWYAAKYGGYQDKNENKQLDGTEWQSADDPSVPVGYYKVINPALLKEQLTKAVAQKVLPPGSFAAAASNSTDLKTLTAVYQGKYYAKYWSGQLLSYPINTTAGTIAATASWDAGTSLPAYGSRNAFTYRAESKSGVPFKWASLNGTGGPGAAPDERGKLGNDSNQLDYILGRRTNEGTGTSNFRVRDPSTVLGDIVNSQPIFSGDEDMGYANLGTIGTAYVSYLDTKKTRTKAVYVGANDGMLHAFNANDGTELFAYIPRAILLGENASQLSTLISKTYAHKYFVDGPITIDDYHDGSNWHTALVGTLGAGGKSIYALNIDNPASFSSSSVMWEFSHPELGYVRNAPIVARLNDGNFYVITGNGFESDSCRPTDTPRYTVSATTGMPGCGYDNPSYTYRNAKLFLIKLKPDLSDGWTYGSDYFIIDATNFQPAGRSTLPASVTGSSPVVYSNGEDNGLSGPAVIDGKTNQSINYIYAGDLQGNVWKFDVNSNTPSAWSVAYKLYQAKDAGGITQPITTSLAVGTYPTDVTKQCVSVGTGRFVYDGDLVYKATQSAYGLIDSGAALSGTRPQLFKGWSVTKKMPVTVGTNTWNAVFVSNTATAPTDGVVNGWYIDLLEPPSSSMLGERIFQSPIQKKLRTNELLSSFMTAIPTGDACDASGFSFSLDFNACTGDALSIPTFDLDGNGQFNSADKPTNDAGSFRGVQVGASDATNPTSAICFESKSGAIKGCSFDLAVMSCTDGRIFTVKKAPTSTQCGVARTSWRQLR